MKVKLKATSLVVHLIYVPWSMYLWYLVLTQIRATDLMWFLFWGSIPLAIVTVILGKLAEWEED